MADAWLCEYGRVRSLQGADRCPDQEKGMRDSSFVLNETAQHAVCGSALDLAASKCVRGFGRLLEQTVWEATRPDGFASRPLAFDI